MRLHNAGDAEVRIWRTGNEWGDRARWFDVALDDEVWRVVLRPQLYTRNVPSSVIVAAGGTHDWPFDLGDGEWKTEPGRDRLTEPAARLVAVYRATQTPEALGNGVWTGEVRSAPVHLDETPR